MSGTYTHLQGDAIKGAIQRRQQGKNPVVIPHVCNNIGKWGSGFVVALNKTLGFGPKQAYQLWGKHLGVYSAEAERDFADLASGMNLGIKTFGGFKLGQVQFVKVKEVDVTVANMIGQHQVTGMDESGRPPIRYGALAKSMQTVAANALEANEKPEIHCPRFGSELAGGNFQVISEMIREIWVDEGLNVTVYEFQSP